MDDAEDLDLVMPMQNLLEYSFNCSDTTGSLWFYSKDKATNFKADITNTDGFISFKYKAELLQNTVAQPNPNQANGNLENAANAIPLQYRNNFWRSLEIWLINCKVELELKWTKHHVSSVLGNENDNPNDNNVFTIKDIKLFVLVVNLLAKVNQILSKLLSKGFETSVYRNECKAENVNKNVTNG